MYLYVKDMSGEMSPQPHEKIVLEVNPSILNTIFMLK